MKKFKLPSAYTIVFIALLITAVFTYFIPVSVFDEETKKVVIGAAFDDAGKIVHLDGAGTQPVGLWGYIQAPIKGFQDASDVCIALLIASGFLNVLNYTGALEAGIGSLITKFKGSVLIAVITFIFALLGAVFGFWEEIPPFVIVIIPLFVLAGYDVITGIGVIFLGALVGNMASIVNPFSVGAAVAAIGNPDLSLGSGILLRIIIFFALYFVALFYLLQYANKVKDNKEKSIIKDLNDVNTLVYEDSKLPELNKKRMLSIIVFVMIVVFLIIGYIPWFEFGLGEAVNAPVKALGNIPILGDILGFKSITPFGEWYFNEFSFLFFVGAFLLMVINKIKEGEFFRIFLEGAQDSLGIVLILGISRGISVIMGSKTAGMSVTLVYWISNTLSNVPLWIFAIVAVIAFLVIGIFLQSTSGVASISMPILGTVAGVIFAATAGGEVGGQIILISAFTVGINFIAGIYPGAIIMGCLELTNIPFNYYLKFILKPLIMLAVVAVVILSIAPYIGLAA